MATRARFLAEPEWGARCRRGVAVADLIKCTCAACGAKYRLPVEAQGRSARCKRCGKTFHVPREQSLEDTILTWLDVPDEEAEDVSKPRVISMPKDAPSDEAARKMKGPIRMKGEAAEEDSAKAKSG